MKITVTVPTIVAVGIVAAAYLFLSACSDGGSLAATPTPQTPGSTPQPMSTPATVDGKSVSLRLPAGEYGILEHDSGVRVEIPSGAVNESVTVSISEVEPPGPELPEIVELGRVFDISIDHAELAGPVTIRIPYESKAGTTAEDVFALHWDEEMEAWEALEGEVDESGRDVRVEVTALSWFTTMVRDITGLYDYTSEDAWVESCEASPGEIGSSGEFAVSAMVNNRSVQDKMYMEFIVKDGTRGLEWKLESASASVAIGETKEFRVAERLSPPGDHAIQCILRVGLPGREEMEVAFPTSLSDLNELLSSWLGPELDRVVGIELHVGEFTKSGRTEAQLSECSAEAGEEGAVLLRAAPFRMEKVGQYKYFKVAFTVYHDGEQVYGHEPEDIGYWGDNFGSLDGGWETTFSPEASGDYTLDCVLIGNIHLFGKKHAILKIAEAIQDPLGMGWILDEWTRAANAGLQWYSSTGFSWTGDKIDERKGFGLVEPTRLTDDPADDGFPVWSPDGRRIAFSSTRDGDYNIYVMNADGSNLTQLTDDPAADQDPSWSPDGQRIAYVSLYRRHRGNYRHDLRVLNADGTEDVPLIAHSDDVLGRPSWSPDGQFIAFQKDNAGRIPQIAVMELKNRSIERLTSRFEAEYPIWSPDGQLILFSAEDRSKLYSTEVPQSDVFIVNVDGSAPTNLTDDNGWDGSPSWSPDGRRIAFGSSRDIYMMNADGSGVTQLTDDPSSDSQPSWSPDGRRIAFLSNRDGDYNIYVMNADGSSQTQLTDFPGYIVRLNWSPDGQHIAFQVNSDDSGMDIYLINVGEAALVPE